MNTKLQNKIKELASNYKIDDALKVFNKIKELLSNKDHVSKKDYFIHLAYYFDYEPTISYYLFKESYKEIANDIFKDIVESNYNDSIVKISSNVFGALAFKQEKLFLSKAAKDAFEESFKDYFKEFESIALAQNKKIMLDMKSKSTEDDFASFFKSQSENSVYKERLQENIKSVFE